MTLTARTYSATSPDSGFAPLEIERRDLEPNDVHVKISHCGLCHSDVHTVRSEWGQAHYPLAPGHEIVGTVEAVGSDVTDFQVGDPVGVGVMVDSCRECAPCREGRHQFCQNGFTGTYNAEDKRHGGEITQGGYSSDIIVHEDYVLRVPKELDPAGVAPLLCAGITTYSPLRHWGAGPDKKVGVVGLGGLGHMAVKLAAAMGAEVTVFTTSESKAEAARELGAHHVVVSKDAGQMSGAHESLDLIINTVSAPIDLNPYLETLRVDGVMVMLGLPETPHPPINVGHLIGRRRSISGSLIGGIPETQEMLDFCAEHGITADVEVVDGPGLNAAYERMVKADVKYRFVLDAATL